MDKPPVRPRVARRRFVAHSRPMFRLPRQSFRVWVSLLALFAQLVLPMAHAQSWAARNGDPLLFAFCGQISPAAIEAARRDLPPELLAGLAADPESAEALSCPLCLAVHGGIGANDGAAIPFVLPASAPPERASGPVTAPWAQRVQLPPQRGPPRIS